MADLDSRARRESGIGIHLPFARVLPTPDGDDAATAAERAHLALRYNGLAPVEAVEKIIGGGGAKPPLGLVAADVLRSRIMREDEEILSMVVVAMTATGELR